MAEEGGEVAIEHQGGSVELLVVSVGAGKGRRRPAKCERRNGRRSGGPTGFLAHEEEGEAPGFKEDGEGEERELVQARGEAWTAWSRPTEASARRRAFGGLALQRGSA